MISKSDLFNMIEEILSNLQLDESTEPSELADIIVEVLDERGVFEESSPDSTYD